MHGFRWLVVLIPFLVGCSCNERLSDASGSVVANPAAIDFGEVYLGSTSTIEVEFRTTVAPVVTLRAADIPASFLLAPATLELAPGSNAKWTFFFSPEMVGPVAGTAGIALVGATNGTLDIAVTGVGLSRETEITEIDFGLVPLGEVKTLPFPVMSDSAGALDVGGSPWWVASPAPFPWRKPDRDQPGASANVDLRFAPDRRGEVYTWVEAAPAANARPSACGRLEPAPSSSRLSRWNRFRADLARWREDGVEIQAQQPWRPSHPNWQRDAGRRGTFCLPGGARSLSAGARCWREPHR